jgi:hypothetical protein
MPLPSLPVATTWSSEELVLAPALRAQVSDAVALLAARPMFIGEQTVANQIIPDSTTTTITLDTELYDNFSGHQIDTDPSRYYGMLTGYYLCEATVPLVNTGSPPAGTLSAQIGGVQGGGPQIWFGGMRTPNNNGHATTATAAKLMTVAIPGYGSGDFMQAAVYQSSGSPAALTNSATKFPYMSARWVGALTGSEPLPVPANPSWPSPPTVLGHAFMNANVRDTINFLIYPPVFEAQQEASQNLASQSAVPGTGTTIAMGSNSTAVDTYGAWDTGNSTWTAPVSGLYYAYGQVALTTAAGAVSMAAGLTVNSSNYNSGSTYTIWGGTMATNASTVSVNNVRRRLRLNAGDTIRLAGFQKDSSAASNALNTSGSWLSRIIIVFEAA